MQKIVREEEISEVVQALQKEQVISVDTETYGLNASRDRLFGISMAASHGGYYFNFNNHKTLLSLKTEAVLPYSILALLKPLFDSTGILWVGHNLKFDLRFLENEGLIPKGRLWCTLAHAKILDNSHMGYKLDDCAKRIGLFKDDGVMSYMLEHECYTDVDVPGKDRPVRNFQFSQVPLEVMAPYALKDARLALELYLHQRDAVASIPSSSKPVAPVMHLEEFLIPAVNRMEAEGMLLDKEYCEQAAAFEKQRQKNALADFMRLTGKQLTDSAVALGPILRPLGIEPGITKKGQISYTKEILEKFDHPLTKAILEYRNATKRWGSYFANFLYFMTADGKIHCSINPYGTKTGRFSISGPAMQTLPGEEDEGEEDNTPFPVRRCFTVETGFHALSMDYKGIQFRTLLDFAGEMPMIEAIKAGLDPHEATAQLMGVPRKQAKSISFGLLFGEGIETLSHALGVSIPEAKRLKQLYFDRLPAVEKTIKSITNIAESRGVLYSILGRRLMFPDARMSYKGVNHVMQAAEADTMKTAIIGIDELLRDKKTKLLMCVHDELQFKLHDSEHYLVPLLKEIMLNSYPHRFLKMDVSCIIGPNFHDLVEFRNITR